MPTNVNQLGQQQETGRRGAVFTEEFFGMVSLSYTDTALQRRTPMLRRSTTRAFPLNWRLMLAIVLNVALWTGVAKLLEAAAA